MPSPRPKPLPVSRKTPRSWSTDGWSIRTTTSTTPQRPTRGGDPPSCSTRGFQPFSRHSPRAFTTCGIQVLIERWEVQHPRKAGGMTVKFLNRSLLQRLFGLPATGMPQDPQCWTFSGGKIQIDLARAPELKAPGGALRLEGGRLPRRVLVVRAEDGRFHAFHNRCTHLGHRRLDPVPGTGTVQCCSVNKSTYS